MAGLRVLLARILALVRPRSDADLDDEIGAHLELLTAEHVQRGLPIDDARRAARKQLGAVEQMKESYRDQRGVPLATAFAQDLRYAFRALRRTPLVAAVMVFSLGLGIGANGAVFTLVDAIFLKTLVVRSPDELVTVSFVRRGERRNESSYPVYRDLHELEQVFSGILAAGDQAFVDVTLAGGPLLQASQLRGRRCKTTGGTTIKSSWSQERAVSARSGIGGGVRWSSSWCRVRSCS